MLRCYRHMDSNAYNVIIRKLSLKTESQSLVERIRQLQELKSAKAKTDPANPSQFSSSTNNNIKSNGINKSSISWSDLLKSNKSNININTNVITNQVKVNPLYPPRSDFGKVESKDTKNVKNKFSFDGILNNNPSQSNSLRESVRAKISSITNVHDKDRVDDNNYDVNKIGRSILGDLNRVDNKSDTENILDEDFEEDNQMNQKYLKNQEEIRRKRERYAETIPPIDGDIRSQRISGVVSGSVAELRASKANKIEPVFDIPVIRSVSPKKKIYSDVNKINPVSKPQQITTSNKQTDRRINSDIFDMLPPPKTNNSEIFDKQNYPVSNKPKHNATSNKPASNPKVRQIDQQVEKQTVKSVNSEIFDEVSTPEKPNKTSYNKIDKRLKPVNIANDEIDEIEHVLDDEDRIRQADEQWTDEEEIVVRKPVSIEELKRQTLERLKSSTNIINNNIKSNDKPKVKKETKVRSITLSNSKIVVKELALILSVKPSIVVQKLIDLGELEDTNVEKGNSTEIDSDTAELIGLELGFSVHRENLSSSDEITKAASIRNQYPLEPRPPVVCVMGHVDHGKTTLLDKLRSANVASTEAGGITQKLSAFTVKLSNNKSVVFLDTPGHAAFSSMRQSGAQATDIVVLVVAMDDGVKPQTREAAETALRAGCSIVIVLNKVDKIPMNDRVGARARVLNEIASVGLIAEDFGGDHQVVQLSARTGEGVDELVESLSIQAEVLDLRAHNEGPAVAVVLNAGFEKGRGVVVDAVVKDGKLSVADCVVVGHTLGRIKSIHDGGGNSLSSTYPGIPVRLTGLRDVPLPGQILECVDSEHEATRIVERRRRLDELRQLNQSTMSAPSTLVVSNDSRLAVAESKSDDRFVNVILKADGNGTLEALKKVVHSIASRTSDVKINILASSIGDVNLQDAEMLSSVEGDSLILAFNVSTGGNPVKNKLKTVKAHVARDVVIYRLEEELLSAMQSKLPPEKKITVIGSAIVQKVFEFTDKSGLSHIAGLKVISGLLRSDSSNKKDRVLFKLIRKGEIVADDLKVISLNKFKDTVNQVNEGEECGIRLDNVIQYEVNDELVCYTSEAVTPTLKLSPVASN